MTDSSNQTLNVPSLLLVLVLLFLTLRYFFFAPSSRRQEPPGSSHGGGPDPAQVDLIESMFPQFSRREIIWDLQRNGGSMPATTERILAGRGLDAIEIKVGAGLIATKEKERTIEAPLQKKTLLPCTSTFLDIHPQQENKETPPQTALANQTPALPPVRVWARATQPPSSFQPPLPQSSARMSSSTRQTSGTSTTSASKPTHPDLITRYNLASRLNSIPSSEAAQTTKVEEEAAGAPAGKWASSREERQALLKRRREEMILTARRKLEEEEERGV